jgi:hypothetical protein
VLKNFLCPNMSLRIGDNPLKGLPLPNIILVWVRKDKVILP